MLRVDCKKVLIPSEKLELVVNSGSEHGISTRNECKLVIICSLCFAIKRRKIMKTTRFGRNWFCLQTSIKHGDFGRCTTDGETWVLNGTKRVYRIYKSMNLNLRSKRKKRLQARVKEPLRRPIYSNVAWGNKLRKLKLFFTFFKPAKVYL